MRTCISEMVDFPIRKRDFRVRAWSGAVWEPQERKKEKTKCSYKIYVPLHLWNRRVGKAWKNPLKKPQTKTSEKGNNCMKKRKPIQHAPDLMSKDEGALRSTNVLQKLKSKTRLHCLESKTEGDTALRKTRTMPALRNTARRNAKSANAPRTPEVASRMAKYQNRKAKAEQGANPCWG